MTIRLKKYCGYQLFFNIYLYYNYPILNIVSYIKTFFKWYSMPDIILGSSAHVKNDLWFNELHLGWENLQVNYRYLWDMILWAS